MDRNRAGIINGSERYSKKGSDLYRLPAMSTAAFMVHNIGLQRTTKLSNCNSNYNQLLYRRHHRIEQGKLIKHYYCLAR